MLPSGHPFVLVYLRKEKDGVLVERAKVVRAEFVQAITTHWATGSAPMVKNIMVHGEE